MLLYPRIRWSSSILLLVLFDFCSWMAFKESSGISMFPLQDKVMHILAFFTLFTLGHISLRFDFFPKLKSGWILSVANWTCWISYGLFIELVHRILDYRTASIGDLFADLAGMALGAAFVALLRLNPGSKRL